MLPSFHPLKVLYPSKDISYIYRVSLLLFPSLSLLSLFFSVSILFFAFYKIFVPFKLYYCIEILLFHFPEAYFSLIISWRSLYISINASSVFFFLITTSIPLSGYTMTYFLSNLLVYILSNVTVITPNIHHFKCV